MAAGLVLVLLGIALVMQGINGNAGRLVNGQIRFSGAGLQPSPGSSNQKAQSGQIPGKGALP